MSDESCLIQEDFLFITIQFLIGNPDRHISGEAGIPSAIRVYKFTLIDEFDLPVMTDMAMDLTQICIPFFLSLFR